MPEEIISITFQQIILGIILLSFTYFIFELNKSMMEGVKNLKIETTRLKIDKNKFRRDFIVMFLENRIVIINSDIWTSYLVFFTTIAVFYTAVTDPSSDAGMFAFILLLALIYIVFHNIEKNYSIPIYRTISIAKNIEELLAQLDITERNEKYTDIKSFYRLFSDENIEFTRKEREKIKEKLLKILP